MQGYINQEQKQKEWINMNNNNIISYENGYNFLHDLLSNYDTKTALQIAKNYLNLQTNINNSWNEQAKQKNYSEYSFCCELYQAILQHVIIYKNKSE